MDKVDGGLAPPPTFSNRFCGRMGGRWDPTFATRSHFGSSLREVEHLHPRAGPVLPSMSASPADILELLSAASPADIESSSESALSQESPQDLEPMLQPVAGGGFEPRVGDRYFVIDNDVRRAAPTLSRTERGRRCPVCILRVAQCGFASHVNG